MKAEKISSKVDFWKKGGHENYQVNRILAKLNCYLAAETKTLLFTRLSLKCLKVMAL